MLAGTHRGVVTRASEAGIWIKISADYPGVEFGPCDMVANAVRLDATTGIADYIAQGDDVLVIETGPADFVIVGTIRTGVSETGVL